MRLRRGLHLLLALALLGAWQGSLVHPLAHADAQRALVHLSAPQTPKLPDGGGLPGLRCDALAAVTVCIGNAAMALAAAFARSESAPRARRDGISPLPRRAYHSQAPPAALL